MHKRIRDDLGRFGSPLLLPEEVMAYLRLNAEQLQRLVQEGAISALPLGSIGVRFHKDQVVDDLEAIELRIVEQAPGALPEPASERPQLAAPEPPRATDLSTPPAEPDALVPVEPVQEEPPKRLYEPDGPILYPPRRVAVPSVLPVIRQLPAPSRGYIKLNGQDLANRLGISYVTMLARVRKGDEFLTSIAELEKTDPTEHQVFYVVLESQVAFFREYYDENPHKNSFAWKRKKEQEDALRAQARENEQPPVEEAAPRPKAEPAVEPARQPVAEPRSLFDEVQKYRQKTLPPSAHQPGLKPAAYDLILRGRFAAANHCGLAIGTFNDLIKPLVEEGKVEIRVTYPAGIMVEEFKAGELEDLRQMFHPLAREARGEIERLPARRPASRRASNY